MRRPLKKPRNFKEVEDLKKVRWGDIDWRSFSIWGTLAVLLGAIYALTQLILSIDARYAHEAVMQAKLEKIVEDLDRKTFQFQMLIALNAKSIPPLAPASTATVEGAGLAATSGVSFDSSKPPKITPEQLIELNKKKSQAEILNALKAEILPTQSPTIK